MKKTIVAAVLLAATLCVPLSVQAASQDVIAKGIYIQGIDVGGKTRTEATMLVDSYFQRIADTEFQLICADRELVTCSLSDWEFTWNTEEVINTALSYSGGGYPIRQYKNQMNLKYSNLYLDTTYSISEEAIEQSLQELAKEHDHPAVNPVITHTGDSFTMTENGRNGKVTNMAETIHDIRNTLASVIYEDKTTPLKVEVTTQVDYPDYSASDVSGIKDKLGSFSTDYSSSSDNRKTNIAVAAGNLNGTILMPGQSCSTSETIKARTEENGYKIAAQYSNGEAEKDIGGGVCQVSTTLYNAVLRAELQVDERHNHSMIVHYVDYGDDAAIATGSKDLVFTNNLSTPVYIEGVADGDILTFSIYGTETRPENRRVEYKAETIYEKWPDREDRNVKYSSELRKGRSEISGTVRPEVSATLTKIVYIDDVETERTLLHTDYYQSSKQTITYGTKE